METHIKVPIGMSMLEAAHEHDIELEGACEGSCACSTCHVIVRLVSGESCLENFRLPFLQLKFSSKLTPRTHGQDMEYYNKLEDPTDEENDMLDLAFGLTETSRLGCQMTAKPELDGICLELPSATRNFAVDRITNDIFGMVHSHTVIVYKRHNHLRIKGLGD
ncbi:MITOCHONDRIAL FERREDOXIN 2 [Prunus dulcis]|uniref:MITOCHONDRIAL FERREDOXIN 2 n=1 Tax=Prunus dulcis TaxID=3755 RepID=A0A4Y1R3X1_PRUDU|nr:MITOCHONDRIAL FERREDOXIN 2 [Prunus dulcis]